MKKIPFLTVLALTLALGMTAGAFGRENSSSHDSAQVPAYNEHGGGHEQAQDNAAIHNREMNSAKHSNAPVQSPAPAYDEHGGGHEQAQDNEAIHNKEMQDPAHKDESR